MKTLILSIGFLAILDLGFIPMILLHIRKTGGFHYLISTAHKFILFTLVFFSGFVLFGNGTQNLLTQLAFCVTFLFLFNSTFELNDYIFKMFQPEKYPLEGLTDEGKKMMEFVFEDMNSQNNKSFGQRFSEMSANFTTNLFQDLAVIFMVVTNNQTMKNTYTELHSMLGTTERFSAMSNKELFFMIKNRLVIDTVILAFVIFTVLV